MAGPIAQYVSDFIRPAHPKRIGVEPRGMPRLRDSDGSSAIFRLATEQQIKQGFRVVPDFRGPADEDRRVALQRLRPSWVRHHFFRRHGGKASVYWTFTTYDEDACVDWIQFDFDRHYPADATPDDKAEIDFRCRQQVNNLREIADEHKFDIVWTTSPGDIDRWTGQHIHGLYAWIKLDRPYFVEDLRHLIKAFKDYHGLETECCWDTTHRNVRLPGQEYVELADPETITIKHPVKKRPREALEHFALAWAAAKPAKAEQLFAVCSGPSSAGISHSQASKAPPAQEVNAGKAAPAPAVAPTPVQSPVIPATSGKHWSRAACLAEPNTFKAATAARLCSRLARKYQGDVTHLESAVQEAMQGLKEIRPVSSRTCGDPRLLRSTTQRWLTWYFKGFDPRKAHPGHAERDEQDRQRVNYCMNLDRQRVLRSLKTRKLTYREKVILSAFLDQAEQWRYRVAAKAIYSGSKSICTKHQWFSLLKKLRGVLVILVVKDTEKHKCTQWGLAGNFVDQLKETEQVVATVIGLKEETEKKEKLVYGTSDDTGMVLTAGSAACPANHEAFDDMPSLMSIFSGGCAS